MKPNERSMVQRGLAVSRAEMALARNVPLGLSAIQVLALLGLVVQPQVAKRRLRSIPPSQLPYHPFGRERLYKEEDVVSYFETRRVA